MSRQPLSVAVPWGLSHYIPLNGFNPLYEALFENPPENILINAWDNIELSQVLRGDNNLRAEVLDSISAQREMLHRKVKSNLAASYIEGFFPPNIALTSFLPGGIEFHHTAPFASLTRPFVLHCESFAPIISPFYLQKNGRLTSPEALRGHYRRILSDSLCLGIFSHIPETLRDISLFFDSPDIDKKLYQSRIGLSTQSLPTDVSEKRWPITSPRFLFINSANQNPANFFHCGGHIALRFWRELRASGHCGKLYLYSARPSDELLGEYGVDVSFLHAEESNSIIWIRDYLTNQEVNALMVDVHFLLLPSASLHSVSIMKAMALGTVPVVSDTVGTSLYVSNEQNGIVLEGVFSANCTSDSATGVPGGGHHRNQVIEDSLVTQLTRRITTLLEAPHVFHRLRQNALSCARTQFSGDAFNDDFWTAVQALCAEHRIKESCAGFVPSPEIAALERCTIDKSDWPRIFESVPQPVTRIYSGNGRVAELGGAFIHTVGSPSMELHGWSVLAEYYKTGSPKLSYAKNIKELGGRYMAHSGDAFVKSRLRAIMDWVSRALMPFPSLHRLAARILKVARKLGKTLNKTASSKPPRDIQLVVQGISGMNVIRYIDKYYVIPQSEGEFLVTKAENGEYNTYFAGDSLEEVLHKCAENDVQIQAGNGEQSQSKLSFELIEEGLHGFNIIRFSDNYYAVPQSEGAFEYDRVLAGAYGHIYVEPSLAAIKAAIMGRGV